jgi:hypothetical protein
VEVTKGPHTWRLQPYYSGGRTTEPTATGIQNIQQAIQSLPVWEEEILHNINLQATEDSIHQEIQQPLKIASDGSVQGHQAAFTWTIATATGTRLVT